MPHNSGIRKNDFRYEIKIPLQQLQYLEFNEWMARSGAVLRKQFPDRNIHSVYLDTAFLDDYQDNVSGISQRGKTRLRWYNEETENIVLELKNKKGRLANKLVIPLNNPSGQRPFDRSVSGRLLQSHERSRTLARELCLFPCLHVHYRRAYYEIAPGIRMTLDRDIDYQRLYPVPTCHIARSPVDIVIEFKYEASAEKQVTRLLSGMPGRIFRHSKYVIGIDSVCDL